MQHASKPLRRRLLEARDEGGARGLHAPDSVIGFDRIRDSSALGPEWERLSGRSVLVSTETQLASALALIDLDGLARRIVLAPPDLEARHRGAVIADAEVDAVLTDDAEWADLAAASYPVRPLARLPERQAHQCRDTEWVLLTSGTTGVPKMVLHTRDGLTDAIRAAPPAAVWGTFYDIRRYGGLQILLRAVLGNSSLVLSQAGETVGRHLARLAAAGVTNLSGTPSHWRRAVMSPEAGLISPSTVRLSGEIADQAILDTLARTYPTAAIGHAYASTEAGVGFEVDDGLEGFPARYLDPDRPVRMKVEGGSLRIRSTRTASRYVGPQAVTALVDEDGFVDTDDLVERRGDRLHFVGRRSGVINVGGLKVNPEEVEAVINRHPGVRMSLVKARANPITGAIVVADIVPEEGVSSDPTGPVAATLKTEILAMCRDALPSHKVPVMLRFADVLAVTPAGKLARHA